MSSETTDSTCKWCEGKAGCSVCGSDLVDSELPNELARIVGKRWLEEYGDHEDKAFVAAGVYRMMRLAMLEPDAPELERYR